MAKYFDKHVLIKFILFSTMGDEHKNLCVKNEKVFPLLKLSLWDYTYTLHRACCAEWAKPPPSPHQLWLEY
jgi:hypothetical protein